MSTSLPIPLPAAALSAAPQGATDLLSGSALPADLTGEFGVHLKAELNAVAGQANVPGVISATRALVADTAKAPDELPLHGKGLPLIGFLDSHDGLNIQLAGAEQTFRMALPESGDFSFSFSDGEGIEGFGIQLAASTNADDQSGLSLTLADKGRFLSVNFFGGETTSEVNLASSPALEQVVPTQVVHAGQAEQVLLNAQVAPHQAPVDGEVETVLQATANAPGDVVTPAAVNGQAEATTQPVLNARGEPVASAVVNSQAEASSQIVLNARGEPVTPTPRNGQADAAAHTTINTRPEVVAPVAANVETDASRQQVAQTRTENVTPTPVNTRPEAAAPVAANVEADASRQQVAQTRTENVTPTPVNTRPETIAPVTANVGTDASRHQVTQTRTENVTPTPVNSRPETIAPVTANVEADASRQQVAQTRTENVTPTPANTRPEVVAPVAANVEADTSRHQATQTRTENVTPTPVNAQVESARQHATSRLEAAAQVAVSPQPDASGAERQGASASQAELARHNNAGTRADVVTQKSQLEQGVQPGQNSLNNQSVVPGQSLFTSQGVRAAQQVANGEAAPSQTSLQSTSEQAAEKDSLILKNNEFRRLQNLFEPARQQIDATTNIAQVSRVADQLGETAQRIIAPPPAQASQLLPITPVSETSLSSSTSGLTQLSVDVPLQSDKWQQAFSQRVVWSIGNAQSAQLKIHPAELGMIDIKLTMADDKANVVFNTQHGSVRDAIESALPRLREMLAEQGLNLGNVDVREEGKSGQQAAGEQGDQQQAELSGNAQDGKPGREDATEEHELVTAFQVDDDSVDYFV